MNATVQAVQCAVCDQDLARHWGTEYKGHTIVKCAGCGLRYVNPRRNENVDRAVYDTDEYFADGVQEESDPDRRNLRRAMYGDFCRRILGYCGNPHPSLLDVGTGTGLLLYAARETGFGLVAGTDVTDVNRDALAADGIPLIVGDITRMPAEDILKHVNSGGGFDAVSLSHVLEHVADPNVFLQALRRLLLPGGVLYLLVPNEGSVPSAVKSFMSRIGLKRRAYKHLSPGHHLFFYTRTTLRRVLEKNGFAIAYSGTRSRAKQRSTSGRVVHMLADALRTGTWLEVVARKPT